jgi:hypothetical protein
LFGTTSGTNEGVGIRTDNHYVAAGITEAYSLRDHVTWLRRFSGTIQLLNPSLGS